MNQFRPFPNPPRTQALSSTTFCPPPLDGSLTVPELYEWHLKNTPHHRLFVFSRESGETRTILWPEAVRAVHTGTRLVRQSLGWTSGMKEIPVVAILAAADTISYFTMIMATMRAGYTVFPISPRNSPAAVAHLMSKVQVKHVLIGCEKGIDDLGKKAVEIMKAQHPSTAEPKFYPIPLFEELFLDSEDDPDDIPYEKRGPDEIILYVHSSGSTAFPKPIAWTNDHFTQICLIPHFGERDLTDQVLSMHVIPMYHGMGIFQLCLTASTGLVMSTFEPKSPAHVPDPESHFQAAVATNSDIIFCVPAIIEAWSRKPDYVKWLGTRGGVIFGGGPLNKAVGDYLTSQGVSILILYGSSEVGVMSPFLPAQVDYDWDYFKFPGYVTAEMVSSGNGTYEFVMLSPCIVNTTINGIDAFASSDLFTEHPQKPGYWRVYGRTDDQIIHNTGEKTNPSPLENMLNQDPHVQSAVMFGRGQFQAGVVIDPKAGFKFDHDDGTKLSEFRNKIWPTVQRMNEFAPQHSRIFKEMIIVSKTSKPFEYTAKNTARRQVIINDYAEEIEALYDVVDGSAQNLLPPVEWNIVATLDFVRSVVDAVLNHGVQTDEDIFQHGCDSLQATWIRNSLLRALRDSAGIDTRHLTDNFVYGHPTISSMAYFLNNLATGGTTDSAASAATRLSAMHSMVEKYTASSFPIHNIITPLNGGTEPQGDVVLITGTTGALGSYLLADLVANPAISRVYALNRPDIFGNLSLEQRQKTAMFARGLDPSAIFRSGKVRLLEGDTKLHGLGLGNDTYEEMRRSVTRVIHNAWPVDFNLALSSFEPSIKGLRNLIDFALTSYRSSPPTFVYTGSIGVYQNVELIGSGSLPEAPISPEVAIGTGYTESKWVSEEILIQASNLRNLNSVIVRVGQLSGGLNGTWNTAEWLPALVQSGQICGCLPDDGKDVDWIPLHIAAKALVDFWTSGSEASCTIIHLIHPRPTSWSSLAKVLQTDLSIQLVPFAEWLAKLEQWAKINDNNNEITIEDLRNIPALRLLQFFRSIATKIERSGNALGFPHLTCEAGVRLSTTLSDPDIAQLGARDVRSWLGYWKSVGFIKA